MPEHPIIGVPKFIVGLLNAHEFDPTFTARHSYGVTHDVLEEFDTLRVDVIAVNKWDSLLDTRESLGMELMVDVVIRQRFGQDAKDNDGQIAVEAIDSLVQLTCDIKKYLVKYVFEEYDYANWKDSQMLAVYSARHLKMNSQFLGHMRIFFNAFMDL